MELAKLEFIFDSILEMNMTACMMHKYLRSKIGDNLLQENALPLETLKVVDAVVMVSAVDKVEVVGVVVVAEEVKAGVEANLKSKLQQS